MKTLANELCYDALWALTTETTLSPFVIGVSTANHMKKPDL